MDEAQLAATVDEFIAARARGEYFPRAWYDRLSLDDAYRIQLALVRQSGAQRVGWKVGLTATAIQQQFKVHEPVFGCLLDGGRLASGHAFHHAELIAPGFENELCIVMASDVAPGATPDDVAHAVARVHPAFEVIETRGDLTSQLALALADNAQQHSFVLGPPVERAALPALDKVTVRVRINGSEVAAADGSAVLGHPYNSVVWLAGKLAQFGERVKAGDYIMSGSFTRQFPLAAGDRLEASFAGIGTVTAGIV
ncbi:MAG: fumarylacetoacetate hydrolase family protein [Alphaproteobacteria bacterium]|nr:fumarylacetoacetate hydrolase family protein [Alphaproteobacteria bacterium]